MFFYILIYGREKALNCRDRPGITSAYALIDINGDFVYAFSSKNLDLNRIISETIKFGKVLVTGTDKAKTPGLVADFSAKTGARIMFPEEDLKADEKKGATSKFYVKDIHQSDALAAALFAHKEIKPLLDKIDSIVNDNKKEAIGDKIKELVISKRISIKHAMNIIESPKDKDKIIEKAVSERSLSERDFIRMYNKVKKLEDENLILKTYNENLSNRIKNVQESPKKNLQDGDLIKVSAKRQERIRFLEKILGSRNNDIERLKNVIKGLNLKLSNIDDYYILKKLENLGMNEFTSKNHILNVKKGDILLVGDANIYSEGLISLLKERIFLIVNKKQISNKIKDSLPFIFINADKFSIEEDRYFAFIEKRHFENVKSKAGWAQKIINEYRKERLISW